MLTRPDRLVILSASREKTSDQNPRKVSLNIRHPGGNAWLSQLRRRKRRFCFSDRAFLYPENMRTIYGAFFTTWNYKILALKRLGAEAPIFEARPQACFMLTVC